MWVHVLTELVPGPQFPAAVVPTVTYGELIQVFQGTYLSVQLEQHTMQIPTKPVAGQVAPTNQV